MSVLVRNLITPATDHNHKLSEMTHLMSPGTLHHILHNPQPRPRRRNYNHFLQATAHLLIFRIMVHLPSKQFTNKKLK